MTVARYPSIYSCMFVDNSLDCKSHTDLLQYRGGRSLLCVQSNPGARRFGFTVGFLSLLVHALIIGTYEDFKLDDTYVKIIYIPCSVKCWCVRSW